MTTSLIEYFGTNVKRLRIERGWSQSKLAGDVGISLSHLWKLESGQREPSADVVDRVAEALGVPPIVLLQAPKVKKEKEE